MRAVGTIAAIMLGAVFVVAGGSKVAAGAAWPAQARSFGAPPPVAVALPGIELVVGALLITTIAMPVPAIVAIALLIGFSVLIARQLVEGRHPPCACFGAWSSRPLDESHLVRNAGLVMLAVIALWAR